MPGPDLQPIPRHVDFSFRPNCGQSWPGSCGPVDDKGTDHAKTKMLEPPAAM